MNRPIDVALTTPQMDITTFAGMDSDELENFLNRFRQRDGSEQFRLTVIHQAFPTSR
jgi:hypothetical protein